MTGTEMAGMEGRSPYAGFWVRAVARIIDLVLIFAVYEVVYIADQLGADAGFWSASGLGEADAFEGFSLANLLRLAFFFAFPVFYYVYLHGSYGQTFGKMILRIKVVNEDGSPIDYKKAFLRWLGYFLCDLTFNIGYIWVAFDARKQGLHDKVCKTLVIRCDVPFPEPARSVEADSPKANEGGPEDALPPELRDRPADMLPPALDTPGKPPI